MSFLNFLNRANFFAAVFLTVALTSFPSQATLNWDKLRKHVESENWSEVIASLSEARTDKLSKNDQQLRHFALGIFGYKNNQHYEAKTHFEEYIASKGRLSGLAHYYLADISNKIGRKTQSYMHYLKVIKADVSRHFKSNAKYQLGLFEYEMKRYRQAYKYLKTVERNWRGDKRHPQAIWNLMLTEFKRKRNWRGCLWARKVYSRYPDYELATHWDFDLAKSKLNGSKLGCFVTLEHQVQRMRRWIWAGKPEQAQLEIDNWVKTSKSTKFYNDMLYANYFVYTGDIKKAKNRLLPHYQANRKSHEYLTLLAKVSELSEHYDAAVGLYKKAYQTKPLSKKGRESLFKAAFLSYQHKDYDMSVRLLEDLVKKHRRSGLTRDAKWYLGWIKYLKEDYVGSISEFKYILKEKKKSRRRWASVPSDKIKYWLAMSYLRLGDFYQSGKIFAELSDSNSLNYYSQAAKFRTIQFKPSIELAMQENKNRLPASDDPVAPNEKSTLAEQEEKVVKEEDERFNDSIQQEVEPEQFFNVLIDAEDDGDEEQITVSNIQDPKIKLRFQRVQDLVRLGLKYEARWEMYEIEKRTRNEQYNKALIGTYEGIGAFHRSSRVAALSFASQRQRHGVKGIRYMWEHAYPLVYSDAVKAASSDFAVDKYFVWSIIRAESFYKASIDSPVGARGLMQIMPSTGAKIAQLIGESSFEVDRLYDPQTNVKLGTRYLMRLLKKFGAKVPLAAAGYNAGPHRVKNWLRSFGDLEMDEFIEHIPYRETRNYVKKVTKNFGVYHELYEGNGKATAYLAEPVGVSGPRKIVHRESWAAL